MSATSSTGTQAVDRAALLVATVVHADEPLTFADLQSACDLPKSTTSRMLAALERTELLERNAAGSYVAGPLFWLYAARHDPWEELVRLAQATMDKVGTDTGETVHLSVCRGDRVVQVAQVDSTYLLGTRDWTAVDVPAHTSALGKVMLAHGVVDLPGGDLDQPTPYTIADRDALRRELAQVVRRGWAGTVDELEIGLSGIAAPVRGSNGDVVAALGISGPTPRLGERRDEIGRKLSDRAEQLSGLLRRHTRKEGVA